MDMPEGVEVHKTMAYRGVSGPWWTDQLGLKIEIASHRSLKQNKAYPTSKQLYAARLLRDGSLPKVRWQAFLFDIFHR